MKKYLLGLVVLFFGVVGSTSAFNIQVEQPFFIGSTTSASQFFDPSRRTGDVSRSCLFYNCSNPYRFYQSFDGYGLQKQFYNNNGTYAYYYNFGTGDFSFVIPNSFVAMTNFIGSILPGESRDYPGVVPEYASTLINTVSRDTLMMIDDRDSIRVFTTGSIHDGNTFLQILPKYTSLWWTDFESLNVYLPDSNYPAYTFDIAGKESHWRGPAYTYSTIDCLSKGNNYCSSPTFETTTTASLTKDLLLQRSNVKTFPFQWVSYIKRGDWIDNASRPYTFLGVLSGNKVEFNVFSCYQGNLEVQDGCTEVLHGITQEIFGVNYPKMYGSSCGTTLSTETGALLGQALFGNNSLYQCATPSTSLGNYFSRIDFENNLLYVASADIAGYADQNAIHFDILDEYNLANDYTGRTTSGYDSEVLQNGLASCSGHYNDPAYPGCFLVQVSSGYDPYFLSPVLPGPSKTLLQEAFNNTGKREEVYNNCQNPTYYAERSFVCDNVDLWVNGYNPTSTGSAFSINSSTTKLGACQSEFIGSSSDEYNVTLGEFPLLGGIFKSLSIDEVSLTEPFACINGAINYAKNKSLDTTLTMTGTSFIVENQSARVKRDWFFNLLLLIPALYFIKKSGAIF